MHRRNPSSCVGRLLVALALAAVAAPAAQAMHAPAEDQVATSSDVRFDAATRHHHPDVAQPATRIIAITPARGFDWGDAGIGAAGAAGVAFLATGSALLVKRSNRRATSARLQS
jgi:hypothetical protein